MKNKRTPYIVQACIGQVVLALLGMTITEASVCMMIPLLAVVSEAVSHD